MRPSENLQYGTALSTVRRTVFGLVMRSAPLLRSRSLRPAFRSGGPVSVPPCAFLQCSDVKHGSTNCCVLLLERESRSTNPTRTVTWVHGTHESRQYTPCVSQPERYCTALGDMVSAGWSGPAAPRALTEPLTTVHTAWSWKVESLQAMLLRKQVATIQLTGATEVM